MFLSSDFQSTYPGLVHILQTCVKQFGGNSWMLLYEGSHGTQSLRGNKVKWILGTQSEAKNGMLAKAKSKLKQKIRTRSDFESSMYVVKKSFLGQAGL
jgi:hypothetical protein